MDEDILRKRFAENFRYYREEKDYTQRMLAKELGVQQQHIYRYETMKQIPRATFVYRIAKVLDITMDQLFEERKENE